MQAQDLLLVGLLVFLEGLLSFDNAIALAVVVSPLPEAQRKKALRIGMWCAFLFRGLSLFLLNFLLQSWWLKAVGGLYLLWLAVKYFLDNNGEEQDATVPRGTSFWRVVVNVELLDIMFSADSISAGAGMSSKYWVVLVGGILGIIMMRFAASLFVTLIAKYPRLETTAYLLVGVVGLKLVAQAGGLDVHSPLAEVASGASMVGSIVYGFLRRRQTQIAG